MARDKWVLTYIPDGSKSVCVHSIYSDEQSALDQIEFLSEMYPYDIWMLSKAKFFDNKIKAYKCGKEIEPPL